ncbi:lipase [Opitutaceae bacterium TAV5]|nr:lipase [Opitutaceae bacterium TAV5]
MFFPSRKLSQRLVRFPAASLAAPLFVLTSVCAVDTASFAGNPVVPEPAIYEMLPVANPEENRGDAFPQSVFVEGDPAAPPVLHIALSPEPPENLMLIARCYDFWNHETGSVEIRRAPGNGRYSLHPGVRSSGWYRIEVTATLDTIPIALKRKTGDSRSLETYRWLPFAIVPRPHDAATIPDSPFGIDTGVSSGAAWMPPPAWQAEMAWLTGCRWVRDRMDWMRNNPSRDTFDWTQPKSGAELLARHGLRVLQVIQRPLPAWMQPPGGSGNSFPADLRNAYAYAASAVRNLSPEVQAFEIWNEHDIGHYSDEPPDSYAAMLKAMALGLRHAGVSIKPQRQRQQLPLALLGPFGRNPEVGGYSRILGANNIAPYLDAYSFHTYQPVGDGGFDRILETHMKTSRDMGFGLPSNDKRTLWLTETGKPYGRNRIPDPRTAMEEQLTYLFESHMEAFERGVGPVFTFWLTPYYGSSLSKPKDRILLQFGIMDSHGAPLPAYAALARMTYELGTARLLNKQTINGNRIYLFNTGEADGSNVALALPPAPSGTKSRPPSRMRLPGLSGDTVALDVMGNPLSVSHDAGGLFLETQGFPVYIKNPPATWQSVSTQKAKGSAASSAKTSARKSDLNLGIILRVVYPRGHIDKDPKRVETNWDGLNSNWTPRGYLYTPGETIQATVEIYNFNEKTASGHITPDLPDGFTASLETTSFTVPSMGRMTAKLSIQTPTHTPPDPASASTENEPLWLFRGHFDGKDTTPGASRWRVKPIATTANVKPRAYVFALADKLQPTRTLTYKRTQEGRELRLHLFEPTNLNTNTTASSTLPRPCLVAFHGGGWTGGSPRMMYPFADEAARLGMVGISVEYRLARPLPDAAPTVFDSVEDARSAIRYIRAHAGDLGIDPARIIACGASAGGHLAAATALFSEINDPADDLSISTTPAALILLSPVLDTSPAGYGNAKIGPRWRELSPVEHVTRNLPPTLVFHGTRDTTAPFAGAEKFQSAMLRAGNNSRLVVAENAIHTYMFKDADRYHETLRQMESFLREFGFL